MSRELLSRRGFRSAILAPLLSQGEVIGTLNVTHREPRAFTDADVEILMEVARPLASAVEHARLHAESARRAEELAALNRTSQLITARLDLPSVLETISRSVTALMGSTGCGIGLLSATTGPPIEHAAAHGFRTPGVAQLCRCRWARGSSAAPPRPAGRCAPTTSAPTRAPRGATWTRRKASARC